MLSLNSRLRGCGRIKRQRGLSLVEMMVGIAIGLIVVAGATVLAATQLGENRRLIAETQLQQDMRAALDIVTRELRRAGSTISPETLIWSSADPTTEPKPNVFILNNLQFNSGGDAVKYQYFRLGLPVQTYRYLVSGGKIQLILERTSGVLPAQDVTDRNTMNVESLVVTPVYGPAVQIPCPKLCPGNTQDCWPTTKVINAMITLTAIPGNETSANATIRRKMSSYVRLRNDAVSFNAAGGKVCPA